jgi:hypothetical protein
MKRSMLLPLTLLISFSFLGTANAISVISDPVEPGQGWVGTSSFNGGFGLTTPIEGPNMALFASQNAETYSKSFSGILLEEGDYAVTFWVHNFANATIPPGLTAQLEAGGNDLLSRLASSATPSPVLGAWVQWTLNYSVTAADPRIGETIGFRFSRDAGAGNGGWDSLAVDFTAVPEPTTALLLGLGLFALAGRRP